MKLGNWWRMHICSSCFRKRLDVANNRSAGHFSAAKLNLDTKFYCCGRVPPGESHRKRHGMSDTDSVELAVEALEESSLGVTKIVNPPVPFMDDLPEELFQGRSIEVHGTLSPNASRFSINLGTGKDKNSDIALHFNPRIDRHVIVRNHRIRNKWGKEEITSIRNFPFTRGRNFSVVIFVADEQFLISVNKIHYCAFAFRIPLSRINSLIVLGDLKLNLIQHRDRNAYPHPILKKTPYIIVPHSVKLNNNKCYFRRKIKEITTGSQIEIFGRLKLLPQAFYVNLQKGITVWPHPIIPFHMSYRLYSPGTHKNEREMIFNSWLNGFWGKEEIIKTVPFLPGMDFYLKIVCEENAYSVYVNDKFLYSYNKRDNLDLDSVVIHGDVIITKVKLH